MAKPALCDSPIRPRHRHYHDKHRPTVFDAASWAVGGGGGSGSNPHDDGDEDDDGNDLFADAAPAESDPSDKGKPSSVGEDKPPNTEEGVTTNDEPSEEAMQPKVLADPGQPTLRQLE